MSSAGTRLARSTEPLQQTALAHLLHALNQPLTGLQCSLELASSVPRSSEQQVRTMREGLELTARMRVLVEALRELVHSSEATEIASDLDIDAVLADCVDQLRPVAESRGVAFQVTSRDALPVQADRNRVATVLLRTIGAALSLCQEATDLQIEATAKGDLAVVSISWTPGPTPEFSLQKLRCWSFDDLESEIGCFAFEIVDLQFAVLSVVKLRSSVDECYAIAQHSIHQSSELGSHSLDGDGSAKLGS